MRSTLSGLSPQALRVVAMAVCVPLLAGCYRATRRAALPTPIELVGRTGFPLYGVDSIGSRPEVLCTVSQLHGTVVAVLADTMVLSNLQVAAAPDRASPCPFTGTAANGAPDTVRVLLPGDGSLSARTATPSGARSTAFGVAATVTYVILLLSSVL